MFAYALGDVYEKSDHDRNRLVTFHPSDIGLNGGENSRCKWLKSTKHALRYGSEHIQSDGRMHGFPN